MLYRILLVFAVTAFHRPEEAEAAPAVTDLHQFLPPMPGYIPVYIRPGDTPLEDINVDLAEAFRSYAEKHSRLNAIGARSRNILLPDEKKGSNDETRRPHSSKDDALTLDDFDLNENESSPAVTEKPTRTPQHIQKIKPKKT